MPFLHRRSRQVALWALAALLFAAGAYKIARGMEHAWAEDGDVDLRARFEEYSWFREGAYPAGNLDRLPGADRPVFSPYPPYAFPMMAPCFEPGGMMQGRVVLEAASIAALAVLCGLSYRVLRPIAGTAGAAAAAGVALAFAGNKNVFDLGQFSIVCVGLIALQVVCIGCGRPWLAGVCWALAMLKPQIALPFGVLFLLPRQSVGLIAGGAILGALSWGACAWTGVGVIKVLLHWGGGMKYQFTERVNLGPGPIAAALGIDHRVVQYVLLAGLLGVAVPVVVALRRLGTRVVLQAAGLCAGLGMIAFYHPYYDLVMLLPTMLAMMVTAGSTGGRFITSVAVALTVSVLFPITLLPEGSWLASSFAIARIPVWATSALIPVCVLLAGERRPAQRSA